MVDESEKLTLLRCVRWFHSDAFSSASTVSINRMIFSIFVRLGPLRAFPYRAS